MKHKDIKHNAGLSQLGNLYQYLVALNVCLDSDEGELISIEAVGDVDTCDYNYEVKHHYQAGATLIATHIDFWKSLSNWVSSREVLGSHSKFILLTTAIVRKDTLLSKWNEYSPEKKLRLLKRIIKQVENSKYEYREVKSHINIIFGFSKSYTEKDLLKVLDKFLIKHSVARAEQFYEGLMKHHAFRAISKKDVPIIIASLLGWIVVKGVKDAQNWTLEVDELLEKLRHESQKAARNELVIFPKVGLGVKELEGTYKKSFIRKIEEIPYLEKIEQAAINYTTYQSTMIVMSEQNPIILKDFQDEVNDAGRQLSNLKNNLCLKIDKPEHVSLIKKSKELFNTADQEIRTGNGPRPPEIQSGIIHTNVDETDFQWKITGDDIEDE